MPPKHDLALEGLHPLIFFRLLHALRHRRRGLDRVFNLPHGLQNFDANAERVLFPVDLVLEEAQALRPIWYPAVEDLLELSAFGADVELVHQVHALACPQEGRTVARGLALDGRVGVAEELEFELKPVGTRHVELRREPTGVEASLGRRRRSDAFGNIPDDPVDSPRGDVLDLGDGIVELPGLLVQVIEATLRILPKLAHHAIDPGVDLRRVLLGRLPDLLHELLDSLQLQPDLVLRPFTALVLQVVHLLLIIDDALARDGELLLPSCYTRRRLLAQHIKGSVRLIFPGDELVGHLLAPLVHVRLQLRELLLDLLRERHQLVGKDSLQVRV
mmetsp:Transcript_115389/g.331167  ORF Transcript_115389/g.331167 Transcript_115389/m.331167 type:complete len:331 (+) Transcript_115389:1081-2073(+)